MKTYVDINMKADEKGLKKCMARRGCKECAGTGIIGYQMTRYHPKSILQRNKPCHCGSGKKYKKCCGARPREMDGIPQRCSCVIETEFDLKEVTLCR